MSLAGHAASREVLRKHFNLQGLVVYCDYGLPPPRGHPEFERQQQQRQQQRQEAAAATAAAAAAIAVAAAAGVSVLAATIEHAVRGAARDAAAGAVSFVRAAAATAFLEVTIPPAGAGDRTGLQSAVSAPAGGGGGGGVARDQVKEGGGVTEADCEEKHCKRGMQQEPSESKRAKARSCDNDTDGAPQLDVPEDEEGRWTWCAVGNSEDAAALYKRLRYLDGGGKHQVC